MELKKYQKAAITIGNFDGVHLGHQEMIKRVVAYARAHKVPSLVICFEPQPQEFFSTTPPARLTTYPEKQRFIRALGVDQIICLTFDEQFAQMKAEAFIQDILINQLKVSYVLVGEDFKFGYQRRGDINTLKAAAETYRFEFYAMPTMKHDHEKVSSTQIRTDLQLGLFKEAADLLGRPYSMSGIIIEGDKRGRQLGYPTANIDPNRKVLPLRGVFAVKVAGLDKPYTGMANLGTRPTVDGRRTLLEVNIFDFDQDIYGKEIEVIFVQKIRDEQRFDSIEVLKDQIRQDEVAARKILMG